MYNHLRIQPNRSKASRRSRQRTRCGNGWRSRLGATSRMRKAMPDPVFGNMRQVLGFRRLSFRVYANVQLEWLLICAAHNLVKIFRSGKKLQLDAA